MSKKKHKGKRGRAPDTDVHEVHRYGPLEVRRAGRNVSLSTNWEKGAYEEYVTDVVANRPNNQERINERVEEALSIVRRYNPFDLLSEIAARNTFVDPQNYTESSQENQLYNAEYAQSLVLSQPLESSRDHPPAEVAERFNALISEIFREVCWYFSSEALEGEISDQEKEIRFLSLLRFLLMRGDSYTEHHYDLIRGLFCRHDPFLDEHYGFTTEQVITGIKAIFAQVENNVRYYRTLLHEKANELRILFEDYLQQQPAHLANSEELRTRWQDQPSVRAKLGAFEALQENIAAKAHVVKPSTEVPHHLLDPLSAPFGSNEVFASFAKSPAWPTNDSVVNRKPLMKHDENYFCFMPQLLTFNTVSILESLIREKDKAYFKASYYKGRANYLEDSALKYLGDLLPDAAVFSRLYYRMEEDGEQKRFETDGIVLYDNNIFIVEAKAGALSTSSRRGGLERTRRDLKELVETAYNQALRTKRFITEQEQDRPRFEYEDGSEALVLENKEKFGNIFLVNVTLESLQHLSTQLNPLKALDLIKGQDWPWSVFLNDLRVMSELIESPSEFLVFLKRRIRANDYPQFRSVDELDFLMYFFNDGLYFENEQLKGFDVVQPTGYTDNLNLYYEYIAGRLPTAEKPRLQIPDEYRSLVTSIEATGKEGFTRVTTALLECDSEAFEFILKGLRNLKGRLLEDGREHDLSVTFKEYSRGLTFMVTRAYSVEFWRRANEYCKMKKYQTKIKEWILIIIEVRKNREERYDFRIYKGDWQYDPLIEPVLEAHKQRAIQRHLLSHRKIGRNDPCPCNSGLKYKRCCGR